MKTALLIAVSAAGLTAALPAAAQSVEIREAVARVVVIPEDRTDVAVEVEAGRSGLPAPRVERRGDDVRILGELGRNAVRNCRSGDAEARQPGQGASVEVRGQGRIAMADAPLIVVRTPRDVDVSAGGAVFGSVGRGARSLELGSAGCGGWTVANVDGPVSLNVGGSGSIRAGTSSALSVNVGGSGSVRAGATRGLEANIGGSGSVLVASVIGGGRIGRLSAAVAGSGSVDAEAPVGDVSASIVGSGSVRVASVSGNLSQNRMGSGRVIVGR
jgi:hypothetical protein